MSHRLFESLSVWVAFSLGDPRRVPHLSLDDPRQLLLETVTGVYDGALSLLARHS